MTVYKTKIYLKTEEFQRDRSIMAAQGWKIVSIDERPENAPWYAEQFVSFLQRTLGRIWKQGAVCLSSYLERKWDSTLTVVIYSEEATSP